MANSNSDQYINIKDIFSLLLKYWYLFGLFISVSVVIAYFVNKYAIPKYLIRSTILINTVDESNHRNSQGSAPIQDFNMFASIRDFNNEILFLESTPLIENALKKLEFSVSYFRKKDFSFHEIYTDCPFIVVYDPLKLQPVKSRFEIEFIDNLQYKIFIYAEDVRLYSYSENKDKKRIPKLGYRGVHKFGEIVNSKSFSFKVLLKNKDALDFLGITYAFLFNNINELAFKYKAKLKIEPIDPESSVANITIIDNNIRKAIDFINVLTDEYVRANLSKKNHFASQTISYIEEQLGQVEDSLSYVEEKLQNYRTTNQVMDISVKAGRIYQQLQDLENQRSTLRVQAKYYQSVKEYFQNNENLSDLLAPSSMGIEDPLLTELFAELTSIIRNKKALENNNQVKSQSYNSLLVEITNLKNTIKENINNIIRSSNIALDDINERMRKLNYEVNKLPKTERELLGIERKFELNNEIYNFLLQRRAEAQIAKASNLPDYELIEPAQFLDVAHPKKDINYIIAVFIGIFFPFLYVIYKYNIKQETISSGKDVKDILHFPMIGSILHHSKKEDYLKFENLNPGVSESFRKLRTNLNYFTKGDDNKTILVTSAFANEGKTFTSVNLATVLALQGKKTVLMGFDLRKPKVKKYFGIKPMFGISSYLINSANIADLVQPTEIDNLYLILAGKEPPNPADLIDSDSTELLFDSLKEDYDFIIIDTPPIGLVTDSLLLFKYSDINLFVIRENYSKKKELKSILGELKDKKVKNLTLLLNDSKSKSRKKSYGYDDGYYKSHIKN